MKNKKRSLPDLFNRIEENKVLQAIRGGLILAVPAITCGSIALLLLSIPLPAYQEFLHGFLGGIVASFFHIVHTCTLGSISLILLLTISYSMEQQFSSSQRGILPIISLCSYIAFSVDLQNEITFTVFQSTWLFNAVWIAVAASLLFLFLQKQKIFRIQTFTSGSDHRFNAVLSSLLPASLVIVLFGLLNLGIRLCFGGENFQQVLSGWMFELFSRIGRGLGGSLLFIFSLHLLWFFGIHGANILDPVARNFFESGMQLNQELVQAGALPTEIFSKTFLDTFVLFGGCGTLLCLLIAVFLFERRKSIRNLSKIATLPIVFNMNELLLFGLPVVFNPIYLIPFLTAPLALTVTSYLAVQFGWVPIAVHSVEWTTPIFLSGYAATGSFAGSILQLFNLAVGVAIYAPFVKLGEKNMQNVTKRRIEQLTMLVKDAEANGQTPRLLNQRGALGMQAKSLAGELSEALRSGTIETFCQPQVHQGKTVTGAELLLRWNHPIAGYLYPPLVILLATEAGLLDQLDDFILQQAGQALERIEQEIGTFVQLSVNLTANQLENPKIINSIQTLLNEYHIHAENLGLELTEQTAFSDSPAAAERIGSLRNLGVKIIMDDFGMGHTAITYLQNNQFDVVKLDGSLVRGMLENSRSREIISSIMNLSKTLGFTVIAEYVETPAQMMMLQSLGCEDYQGYLFSPTVGLNAFLDYAKQKNSD